MSTAIEQERERKRANKRAERERKREQGLVKLELWVPPQLHARVRTSVARLIKRERKRG